MAYELDQELLTLLQSVDTPTVCNAIEVAQGKRGFSEFTRGTMICSAPKGGAMVGFAKTAKIAALSPPTEDQEIIKERRMNYYRYMSEVIGPAVAVIEDVDYPNCIGAYWGEVNTKVHKGFGLSGALTNGVMRDLGDLAEDRGTGCHVPHLVVGLARMLAVGEDVVGGAHNDVAIPGLDHCVVSADGSLM